MHLNKKLKYIFLTFPLLTFCIILSCSNETPLIPEETENLIGNAGLNHYVNVWDTVYLNGSIGKVSSDIEFIWSFASKPLGSEAVLSDSLISNPTFVVDKIGWYALELILKQGEKYSEPDYVLIQTRFQKSAQYFPNTIGNEWHYEVKNSNGIIIDTFIVEIVGSTTLPDGKTAFIWAYKGEHSLFFRANDSLYVTGQNDTIVFYECYRSQELYFIIKTYVIPFTVDNVPGTSEVYSKDSISIRARPVPQNYIMSDLSLTQVIVMGDCFFL